MVSLVCFLETAALVTAVVTFVDIIMVDFLVVGFCYFVDCVDDSDNDDNFALYGKVQKYALLNDQVMLV